MMGQNLCFYGEIWLTIPELSLLPLLIWSTGLRKTVLTILITLFQIATLVHLLQTLYYITGLTAPSVGFIIIFPKFPFQ